MQQCRHGLEAEGHSFVSPERTLIFVEPFLFRSDRGDAEPALCNVCSAVEERGKVQTTDEEVQLGQARLGDLQVLALDLAMHDGIKLPDRGENQTALASWTA